MRLPSSSMLPNMYIDQRIAQITLNAAHVDVVARHGFTRNHWYDAIG